MCLHVNHYTVGVKQSYFFNALYSSTLIKIFMNLLCEMVNKIILYDAMNLINYELIGTLALCCIAHNIIII